MVLNICHDVVLNILVTFSGEHCEAGAELCKALHKGEFLKSFSVLVKQDTNVIAQQIEN